MATLAASRCLLPVVLVLLPVGRAFPASEGDRVTAPFVAGTVRVSAVDGAREGFGFVVGVANGDVYLVTAGHVVEQKTPEASNRIEVYFHYDQNTPLAATVVRPAPCSVDRPPCSLDLALLRVKAPPGGFKWQPPPTCTDYEISDAVWWVGRDKKWEVPRENERGELKAGEPNSEDWVDFSGMGVRLGVSGAPLIGRRGIIGMVVVDDFNQGSALDIEKIRRFVREKDAPWQLTRCGETPPRQAAAPEPGRTLPAATPAEPKVPPQKVSCWDGWEHGKICRDSLADGGEGPEMVMLEGGSFRMGSTSGEANRDEKPMSAGVGPFAVGRYEVTRGEFARFIKAAGYITEAEKGEGCASWTGKIWEYHKDFNWREPGFARDDDAGPGPAPAAGSADRPQREDDSHPVVCVSWNDAAAYAEWLGRETHQTYRLPTEAEWEYASRAGTTHERFWGDDPGRACEYANVADRSAKRKFPDWNIHDCNDGYAYSAPVGHYRPNGYGLYDMLGNVWEWTCSLYEESYGGEAARCGSGDGRRGSRGGSWLNGPAGVRAAARYGGAPDFRYRLLGFRLARSR